MRVNDGDLIRMEQKDPFNPENYVVGSINRNDISKLHIRSVNGEMTDETIQCTPKFHYPFNIEGEFHIARPIQDITSYKKYDGTNIVQYTYNDAENNTFVSYKTRKTMFPNENFTILLKQALKKYDHVDKLPFLNHCNIAFELYGYKNPITFVYDTPIDIVVLYGIKSNGILIQPDHMNVGDVPKAERRNIYFKTELDQFKTFYNKEREQLEEQLEELEEFGDHVKFKGSEGSMWYCRLPHNTIVYKLKPPSIEQVHWSQAGSTRIHTIPILNTLHIAVQDHFPLTYKIALEYLLEEYSEDVIAMYDEFIRDHIDKINKRIQLEKDVISDYKEHDLDVNERRGECMRFFAIQYGKELASKEIFNILKKFFIE